MKRILLLTFAITFSIFLAGQDWIELSNNKVNTDNISLLSSTPNSSTIHFALDGYWKEIVATDKGDAWKIKTKNGSPILQKGAPDLPFICTSMIIS